MAKSSCRNFLYSLASLTLSAFTTTGAFAQLQADLNRVDETGTGASVWITKELWGVGSTAPYLHDARATTLTEAIMIHGGEAQASRNAADALSESSFNDLLVFLNSLVLFKVPTAED